MNEIPATLARHPKVGENPALALQETFDEVDRALVDAAAEDEHVYRSALVRGFFPDTQIGVPCVCNSVGS